MTTTHTRHVRQLRLPGQEAAPEGPIDMTGMCLMHFGFRRDLGHFAAAVTCTPVEDRATWHALLDRWRRFGHVLHTHHTREDTYLWPQVTELARGAGDDGSVATLEAMGAEHAEIDPLLESVETGLHRLASVADRDVQAALVVRMAAARECLTRHLAHEERDALAIAQRYVAEEEWKAMEHGGRESPRELAFLVPWVLHELPAEARNRAEEFGGRGLVLLGRMFRRRFERNERAAFRYV